MRRVTDARPVKYENGFIVSRGEPVQPTDLDWIEKTGYEITETGIKGWGLQRDYHRKSGDGVSDLSRQARGGDDYEGRLGPSTGSTGEALEYGLRWGYKRSRCRHPCAL